MIWRMSLAAALMLGLCGCNNVVSMVPWFTAADARGVPKFRDGLWLSVPDADCRVNVAKPAERWPDCARASFVRGDEWLEMAWDDPDGEGGRRRTFAEWTEDPTFFANGDPLIGQVEVQPDPSGPSSDATTVEAADAESSWRFLYYAIRPTRFDERGQVVAFEVWGIQCGPLDKPAEDQPLLGEKYVTDRPFPGLTINGDNCTAESVDALRRAAALSEPLGNHGTARWVRDGWR